MIMLRVDNNKSHVNMIMLHVDINKSHVNMIMLHVDNNKSHVNMIMLHVDKNKSHVNIIMMHVDIIYLAYRGLKYAIIDLYHLDKVIGRDLLSNRVLDIKSFNWMRSKPIPDGPPGSKSALMA